MRSDVRQTLLRAINAGSADGSRAERTIRWVNISAAAALGLLYALVLALDLRLLVGAWQTGMWDGYWTAVLYGSPLITQIAALDLALALAVIAWGAAPRWRWQARVWDEVARLRRAAADGDDALAPRVAPAVGPLPELPRGTETFRRFPPLAIGAAGTWRASGATFAGVGALLVVFAPWMASTTTQLSEGRWILWFVPDLPKFIEIGWICAGVLSMVWAGALWWQGSRRVGLGQLVADDHGLWRTARGRGPGASSVRWGDARAFFTCEATGDLSGPSIAIYALDAGDHLITWATYQDASEPLRADHERLCRLVVTRTGLPLRAITGQIRTALAEEQDRYSDFWAAMTRIPRRRASAPLTPMARYLAHGARTLLLAVAALVVVSVLLLGGGRLLQRVQADQYDALAAHIQAGAPLYHDALAAPDGQWPVVPAKGYAVGTSYVAGTYQIAGGTPSEYAEVLGPLTVRDGAVAVTVRQSGSTAAAVGLVLRQRGDGAALVFTVDSGGNWYIAPEWLTEPNHAPDSASDADDQGAEGQSDAIHTGQGAANRLLVIMRGTQYFGFVNGRFVGAYLDHAPSTGRIGLWTDDGGTVARFSDLTVYSVAGVDG